MKLKTLSETKHWVMILLFVDGGTVGDIESLPFLEAIRQFSNDIEEKIVCLFI